MKSLRARLVTALGLGLALLIGSGGLFLYVRVRDTLREGFDESLRSRARALASRLEVDLKPAFRSRITSLGAKTFAGGDGRPGIEAARAELLRLAEDGFQVRFAETNPALPEYSRSERPDYFEIWLPDGTVLARSASLGETSLGSRAPQPPTDVQPLTLPDGRAGRAVVLRVSDVGFPRVAWTRAWEQIRGDHPLAATTVYVRVAQGVEVQATVLSGLRAALIAGGLFLLLATGVLVWTVSTRALAPLRRLQQQVERLEADSLHQRVELEGAPSELAPVVTSLNASLERLERGFERERKTATHIAHELRTPIAELRSVTEVARQWPEDEALQRRCVEQGQEIAEHMSRIVSALMRVARSGAAPTLLSSPMDLAEVLETAWRRLEEPARARGQTLEVRIPQGLAMQGDPEVVETLLANLLRNAVDHAPRESRIECAARIRDEATLTLTIENPCTDLGPQDMQSITDPFWRKDESRTRSRQGGLGLPLVAEVARSAGLGFELELHEGLFRARLRLARADYLAPTARSPTDL